MDRYQDVIVEIRDCMDCLNSDFVWYYELGEEASSLSNEELANLVIDLKKVVKLLGKTIRKFERA